MIERPAATLAEPEDFAKQLFAAPALQEHLLLGRAMLALVVLAVFFGALAPQLFGLSSQSTAAMEVAAIDEDDSPESRALLERLRFADFVQRDELARARDELAQLDRRFGDLGGDALDGQAAIGDRLHQPDPLVRSEQVAQDTQPRVRVE